MKRKGSMHRLQFIIISFLFFSAYTDAFSQDQNGYQIATDLYGNTYVAGSFTNKSLSFGKFNLKNNGGSDIYLAKYDSNGKILWAKNIGSSGNEKLQSLLIDPEGNISISASSNGKEIEIAGVILKNNSVKMIFNANFSSNGNFLYSNIEEHKTETSSPLLKTSQGDTSVSLLSPEAGDNWKVGTKATVMWSSENVNSVVIELSTDNGGSWEEIYISDLFDLESQYSLIVPNTPSSSCLIKVSDYYNPDIADTSGFFNISGELFWEIKESDFSFVLVNSFITSSLTGWMAGLDGLIKTTDQGESWSSYLTGYGLLDIFFLNDTLGWTVGLSGVIFKTTNGGDDWAQQDSTIDSYLLKVFFADDTAGYMIGGNNFLRTTDGGESWDQQEPTEHTLMTMFFINKDEGWIAGNEGVILKTTDAGISWDYQQMNGTEYGTLTSLYFIDENRGFASGSGLDVEGGVILKTIDGGNRWDLIHNGYNRFVFSVLFTTPDSGWASGDEGIMFNTSNGGVDWELQGSGTFDDLLSVNIRLNNAGWAIGNNGIILKYHQDPIDPPLPVELFSFDAVNLNNEIRLNWITATEINNKGFEIEKQTVVENNPAAWRTIGFIHGRGTTTESQSYSFSDKNIRPGNYYYRLKQIDYDGTFEYSGILNIKIAPRFSFKLEQNYPNPFNPSTRINYSVKENVLVSLKVYDALGSEVATLVNEEKAAGEYDINFNAAEYSSGIYFYVLKAGNFVSAKKMLLIK